MCRHLTIFLQFQSVAPSEAPSLGTAIQKLSKSKSPAMKPIAEDKNYMVKQKSFEILLLHLPQYCLGCPIFTWKPQQS